MKHRQQGEKDIMFEDTFRSHRSNEKGSCSPPHTTDGNENYPLVTITVDEPIEMVTDNVAEEEAFVSPKKTIPTLK